MRINNKNGALTDVTMGLFDSETYVISRRCKGVLWDTPTNYKFLSNLIKRN